MRYGLTIAVVLAWVGTAQTKGLGSAGDCGAMTADLNGDGKVDFSDFFILADQFGMTCVTAADTGGTLTATLPGGVTMEFVWIPPGTFVMGSPDSDDMAREDEKPQHQVALTKGFYLGKYEVTQGQWEAVMGTSPWSGQDYVQLNANHPAVYISWDDIQAFVHKLNTAAGDSLYRLPTEAEWEYACRAGTTTRWSFGDEESQLGYYAWYRSNASDLGGRYAREVGQMQANPWGLFDMHGNVWEWCQDWYGGYSSTAQTDPRGWAVGSERVYRGGGLGSDPGSTRSASRWTDSPDSNGYNRGARLLRRK